MITVTTDQRTYNPTVSIIIDNYNYEQYLADSIESALAQTYPKVEVIVVDDGSTDSSRAILKRYEDKVKVLLKDNGGQASAFNFGFEHSTGDLIMFLDSDDVLTPHAVEKVVEAWDPALSKLHFPLQIIDELGNLKPVVVPRSQLSEGRMDQLLLSEGYYVSPPTTGNVFPRAILECLMPIPAEEWPQGADDYLITQAPFYGAVGVIDKPLAHFRVHEGSLSNISESGFINTKQITKLLGDHLRHKRLLEQIAVERGLSLSPDVVESHWMHLKLRLVSLKLAKDEHLFPQDQLTAIAVLLVRSVWRSQELSLLERLEFALWALSVAVLPVRLAKPLIQYAFGHTPRPKFLQYLTRVLRLADG